MKEPGLPADQQFFADLFRSKRLTQQGTMGFVEYVRWVRMAKTRIILQKCHLSICEEAQRCGYQDSDDFCRLFRPQFGPTPREYTHVFSSAVGLKRNFRA